MEKRINDLQKASGGGGFELPIASAETLGGIKIPADSGITIDGSGNAYAAKPIVYSTDEVDTGAKWIDGKTIYSKCVNVTVLPNNNTLVVGTLSSIDNLISIYGYAKSSNQQGYIRPLPFAAGGSDVIRVDVSNYDIRIITLTDWSSYGGVLILEYTKADPTPEEPEENTEE